MPTSEKDFHPKVKKEENPAPSQPHALPYAVPRQDPAHSQGLTTFLTRLSGAYTSSDPSAIHNAQISLIGALKMEKKIEKKRVQVKKDNESAELFDKTLGVKNSDKADVEMETKIEDLGNDKGKKVKEEK